MRQYYCQSQELDRISDGRASTPKLSFPRRIKLELRRRFHHSTIRKMQNMIDFFLSWISNPDEQLKNRNHHEASATKFYLQTGDDVRIRSREEIEATLNRWKEYKGCGFMDDMWQYCDTVQTVLKPVERFVDERDYQIKNASGIVLLAGLNCQGTPIYGRCDRNCYYFWRIEWLEKID